MYTAETPHPRGDIMAGPPTATEAVIACHFTGPATPSGAVSTLGVHDAGGEITSTELAAALPLFKAFHSKMSVNMCTLSYLEMKVGPDATGPTYTVSAAHGGEAASGGVPPNTCVLVRKELREVSGKFAGRMFWPGMPESQVGVDGVIEQTQLAQMQTAADALFTGLVTLGLEPAVFGSTDLLLSKVQICERFAVQTRVATQRRRLRR